MKKQKDKNKKQHTQTLSGLLEITRSGLGYVITNDGQGDIVVRPQDFNQAFNGDNVEVRVTRDGFNGKKREGRIERVIKRRQTEFIGNLRFTKGILLFIPSSEKPMPYFELGTVPMRDIDEDAKVVVRMTDWPPKNRRPKGELMEVLDADAVNDVAMKELLLEKGFPLEFSDEAMEVALRLPDIIPEKEIKQRKDVRETLTFTIDPADAKDFDDAISFKVLPNGLYEIGVHIADVSHYVEEDTILDEEAYERATSVYLPDRVNPMLPERISNELCSLRPHEDKCTFSVIFKMNDKGDVKDHWIGRTVIHSNHRFTYEDVQQVIETKTGMYEQEVLIVNEISQKLRKKRFKSGAINFSSQEVRFKLDEKGHPIGIVIKESKEAQQLIEELMLLANRYVAERVGKVMVKDKPIPFPYRIHDTPSEEKLLPFTAFAKKFGYSFDIEKPETIAASFNAMLADAKGTPQQHVLEQLGIRTMAKAIYTTENIGHYGLGFEHYCHFTSPIRRYPDIMVHRILQQVLDGKTPVDKRMEQKCKHASERERAAMESERAANKYKQVEFMSDKIGEEFDAVVTGVSSFGFWAETVEHKCEGLISINQLNEFDEFRLVETDYQLVGMRSGRKFRIGDPLRIKVASTNLSRRQMDYEWIINPTNTAAVPDAVTPATAEVAEAIVAKTPAAKTGKTKVKTATVPAETAQPVVTKKKAKVVKPIEVIAEKVVNEITVEKQAKTKKPAAPRKKKAVAEDFPVVNEKALTEPVTVNEPKATKAKPAGKSGSKFIPLRPKER